MGGHRTCLRIRLPPLGVLLHCFLFRNRGRVKNTHAATFLLISFDSSKIPITSAGARSRLPAKVSEVPMASSSSALRFQSTSSVDAKRVLRAASGSARLRPGFCKAHGADQTTDDLSSHEPPATPERACNSRERRKRRAEVEPRQGGEDGTWTDGPWRTRARNSPWRKRGGSINLMHTRPFRRGGRTRQRRVPFLQQTRPILFSDLP